jgi:hypothetical protein
LIFFVTRSTAAENVVPKPVAYALMH